MGHHYIGTVEIKVAGQIKGVWHRFGAVDDYTEYWMLLEGFHMWDSDTGVNRYLDHMGNLPTNNVESNFRKDALGRLGLLNVPDPPVEFWKHTVVRRP